MLLLPLTINENVIEVCHTEAVQASMKGLIDVGLKYSGYVGEIEGPNFIFIVAIVGPEGCLPVVSFLQLYQIVGALDSQLGQDFRFEYWHEGFC